MKLPDEDLKRSARTKLLNALNRKLRTVEECRKLLVRAEFPEEIIEEVLNEAVDQRWLDDPTYAKLWIEDRANHNPKGSSMLARELRQKGVSRDDIDSALDEAELDEDAMIEQLVERKLPQYQHLDPQTRERRIIGMLKRRGFSYAAIRNSVDKLRERS